MSSIFSSLRYWHPHGSGVESLRYVTLEPILSAESWGYHMKCIFCAFAACLLVPSENPAQDPGVRTAAVQLLERANGLSMSPNLPNLERTDVFQVFDTSSPVREGTFTRRVIQGVGRRDETTFGGYHATNVYTRSGLSTVRTSELPPAPVVTLRTITPIYSVSFADDDVIHAIVDKAGSGEQKLRCIEFDTIRGQRFENNEICVDAVQGTLASQRIGNKLIEYRDFFPFAGALMPGEISFSRDGVPELQITQTMAELKESPDIVLAPPPDAGHRAWCTTYKPAIGQSMPQPNIGSGGIDVDVAIRGIIGSDGRIHQALVQSGARPDLGAEALALVQQWVFAPAVCDGKPNEQEETFIIHFHGR